MKGGPLVVSLFQLENLSLIWRRYHYRWRALMAIEQWGFYSVAHLLWHKASVYNDHLREPRTLSHFAERLAVELSLPAFYDSGLLRLGFVHPTFLLTIILFCYDSILPHELEKQIAQSLTFFLTVHSHVSFSGWANEIVATTGVVEEWLYIPEEMRGHLWAPSHFHHDE